MKKNGAKDVNATRDIKNRIMYFLLTIGLFATFYYFGQYYFNQQRDYRKLTGEVYSCKFFDLNLYKYISTSTDISFFGERGEYIPCKKDGANTGMVCEELMTNMKCSLSYKNKFDGKENFYDKNSHKIVTLVSEGLSQAKLLNDQIPTTITTQKEEIYKNLKGEIVKLSHEPSILAGEYKYITKISTTTGTWSVDESSTQKQIVIVLEKFTGDTDVQAFMSNSKLQILDKNRKVVDTFNVK